MGNQKTKISAADLGYSRNRLQAANMRTNERFSTKLELVEDRGQPDLVVGNRLFAQRDLASLTKLDFCSGKVLSRRFKPYW